jgi:hypothetical protein
MKKKIILVCLILACCSSGLFAKTYHHHHHRGEHIYTGETTITPEKVGKIKDICFNYTGPYSLDDYVIYKYHEVEFVYSICHHRGWEVKSVEIVRLAESNEISEFKTFKTLKILGVIILLIVLCILQLFTKS